LGGCRNEIAVDSGKGSESLELVVVITFRELNGPLETKVEVVALLNS
jgi:hypothetical protein